MGSRPPIWWVDPVTTDSKEEAFVKAQRQHAGSSQTKQSMEVSSWYISGFVDGEGSFFVSFSLREKLKIGVEVRPSFAVAQHKRSKEVLKRLQNYFGCGAIRFNKRDQTYKYEVRSLDDLIKKIIPHFEQYPLVTSKNNDFETLRDICHRMKDNQHKTVKGIKQIIHKAYMMNNIGARRYTKDQLLKVVGR